VQGVLARNSSQQKSRCFSNVPVVKSTDLRELNHPSQFRSLDGSRLGRIADERQVTARPVVVRKVPTKDTGTHAQVDTGDSDDHLTPAEVVGP